LFFVGTTVRVSRTTTEDADAHRIFWLMFPRVENGKDNGLKENKGRGGKVLPFRREVPSRVTCYEEALLTFKFYNENDCKYLYFHIHEISKGREARLFVIKPRVFSYLKWDSGENLPS